MDSRVRTLYKIEPRPEGPAQARRIIAEELSSRVPAATLDEVKLMVSELVSDGIVHARRRSAPVMLDLRVNGDILCRVLDHGPGFAARVQEAGQRGWGLRVVEQLADRWGMRCSRQWTEVWFERQLACSDASAA
jgi:anti-sigma regulatory factor (Ser/Thr protein kinase)